MDHEKHTDATLVEKETDAVHGFVVGRLVEVGAFGTPQIEYEGRITEARTTVRLEAGDAGRAVVIAFERGERSAPIVIGTIREPLEALATLPRSSAIEATLDGERVLLRAENEIVLECGEASLTLRRDGKVLIRGTHIVSRSSGPNKISGSVVTMN